MSKSLPLLSPALLLLACIVLAASEDPQQGDSSSSSSSPPLTAKGLVKLEKMRSMRGFSPFGQASMVSSDNLGGKRVVGAGAKSSSQQPVLQIDALRQQAKKRMASRLSRIFEDTRVAREARERARQSTV